MIIRNIHLLKFFLLLSLCLAFYAPSYAALPGYSNGQALPSLAPMLEKSMPAVVNISTAKNVNSRENPLLQDPFFRHFFQLPQQQKRQQKNSLGSGVIIDSQKGLVLTNNHVIDKADTIMVTLSDGRQLNAKLLGTDPEADVAVIQISANNLTELPIANSSELKVGDFVVAIGNPFGLGQTVTSGIISALGRSGLGIEGYEDFIQTDASINPGNSGGALVNLRGEFIGMNTAILAPNGGNVGIGFAIPSNMAMTLKETLVEHGEVRRGLLGVTTQDLTPDLIKAFDLKKRHGALVSKIEGGSAADRAGIEPGDIIVSLNDKAVKGSHQIRNIIGLLQIGDEVKINLIRAGKEQSISAMIGKPKQPQIQGDSLHQTLKDTILTSTQKNQVEGVLFASIDKKSYAWQNGLRPGDIIVSANRYRVRSLAELKQVADPRRALLINIQRGSEAFFLILK
ncbi:MAG: DegQ family serine endoprotease [Methylococcales bacterium]|nr:DegQ family serine endoprotease [Methylococcales bacterium]